MVWRTESIQTRPPDHLDDLAQPSRIRRERSSSRAAPSSHRSGLRCVSHATRRPPWRAPRGSSPRPSTRDPDLDWVPRCAAARWDHALGGLARGRGASGVRCVAPRCAPVHERLVELPSTAACRAGVLAVELRGARAILARPAHGRAPWHVLGKPRPPNHASPHHLIAQLAEIAVSRSVPRRIAGNIRQHRHRDSSSPR